MAPAIVTLSDQRHAFNANLIHSPVLRARSIVSFTDHLPNSGASSSFFFTATGSASSRFSKSPKPVLLPRPTRDEEVDMAFLASARLRATASLILNVGLGTGGSFSTGSGLRTALDGDFGTDLVLTRGEDTLAVGLDGDGARERAGGTRVVFTVGRGVG
jgi:hypothetical protein